MNKILSFLCFLTGAVVSVPVVAVFTVAEVTADDIATDGIDVASSVVVDAFVDICMMTAMIDRRYSDWNLVQSLNLHTRMLDNRTRKTERIARTLCASGFIDSIWLGVIFRPGRTNIHDRRYFPPPPAPS